MMRIALCLARDFQPCIGPLQRHLGAIEISLGIGALEPFFRATLGVFGPFYIDLFGAFGRFGKNGDFIRQNFRKSPRHRQTMRVPANAVADLPHAKFADQRSMSRQDAQIPVLPRYLHLFGHVAHDELLGSHDFELESVCHL